MSTDLRFIEKLKKNCAAFPDSTALILAESGESMTYAELWEYSGRVYSFLKHESIGKEDIVMIALPRGISPVIALIGIWRAGAAAVIPVPCSLSSRS
jgi:acyl-CoA synthetase (AMP-forming)/AMP-acid ligase II